MLSRLLSKPSPPPSLPSHVDGVRVRHNPRARRLSLRADAKTGDIILVWPKRATHAAALRFVQEQKNWIEKQRATIVTPEEFAPGARVTIAGQTLTTLSSPGRGITRIENDTIIVHGKPEFFHRRLRDFLKQEALRHLSAVTLEKTKQLGLAPSQIRIADPKSRWGSCGSDGRIMYSWRLIMAPEPVIDYIVAHETAHRIHMNHGRLFWRLCFSLCRNGSSARRWLKTEGQRLMRYR